MTDSPRILLHNSETDKKQAWLREAFPDVTCEGCDSYDGFPAMVESFRPDVVYSVRFDGTQRHPRDTLFGPGRPRWLANGGAGTDHLGEWDLPGSRSKTPPV